MIYVTDTAHAAEVRIPRTLTDTPTGTVLLELVNTTDRQRYAVPISDFSAGILYYAIRADFAALPAPGEYEYRLTAGEASLACGIIRLGEVPAAAPTVYETAPTYEQYNA